MRIIDKIILGILVFCLSIALVFGFNFNNPLSYIPRAYMSGYGGTGMTGNADILAPILLRDTHIMFVYGQAHYSQQKGRVQPYSWMGSLGLGYRQIYHGFLSKNFRVLGVYVLGDYFRSYNNNYFSVANLGIESLGKKWDFRINGYFPISKSMREDRLDGKVYSDGNLPAITFNEQYYEEIGSGADAEIGRYIFSLKKMPVAAYLNGYYFNIKKTTNITGIGARLNLKPNDWLVVSVNCAYDNYRKDLITAGAQIFLNEVDDITPEQTVGDRDLQMRLFDSIGRNVATEKFGSNSHMVVVDKYL